ncbi:MAG: hypothetical protein Q7U53_17335 [Anaerolineaceae bacterium]|nr:hypothetical protein [Anaerolineaceae bacterium]
MNIRFDTWVKKYKPLLKSNKSNSEDFMYIKFFDIGKDTEFLNKQNPLCLWSVVEWEYPNRKIISGARLVNRLYYIVTEFPFEPDHYITTSYRGEFGKHLRYIYFDENGNFLNSPLFSEYEDFQKGQLK